MILGDVKRQHIFHTIGDKGHLSQKLISWFWKLAAGELNRKAQWDSVPGAPGWGWTVGTELEEGQVCWEQSRSVTWSELVERGRATAPVWPRLSQSLSKWKWPEHGQGLNTTDWIVLDSLYPKGVSGRLVASWTVFQSRETPLREDVRIDAASSQILVSKRRHRSPLMVPAHHWAAGRSLMCFRALSCSLLSIVYASEDACEPHYGLHDTRLRVQQACWMLQLIHSRAYEQEQSKRMN